MRVMVPMSSTGMCDINLNQADIVGALLEYVEPSRSMCMCGECRCSWEFIAGHGHRCRPAMRHGQGIGLRAPR